MKLLRGKINVGSKVIRNIYIWWERNVRKSDQEIKHCFIILVCLDWLKYYFFESLSVLRDVRVIIFTLR